MTRRVPLYLAGLLVLVSLVGCGRGFLQTAEREAWRAEAEAACMKSGAVKEGVGLVRIEPISGPGVCGAQYPLKVAALGGSSSFSFADDPRPPGAIPGAAQPRWPINQQPQYQPPQYQPQPAPREPAYSRSPAGGQDYQGSSDPAASNGPMSLRAPGVAEPGDDGEPDETVLYETSPRLGAPVPGGQNDRYPPREPYPQTSLPQPSLPRLGPGSGMPTDSIGPVVMKPAATLACPLVSQLERWIADSVQPAAMRWFGSPVAEIKQISAYSCRGMNGNSRAHISEHAFGNALDIAAFTLADGRRISVRDGWKGVPEEQGFLRDVQGAACQQFNTVLAPGSNVYHYDHIHFDLMRRSSRRVICQPAAVSGEQVAARASPGGSYAGRDPGITGSVSRARRQPAFRSKSIPDEDDWIEDESNIKER